MRSRNRTVHKWRGFVQQIQDAWHVCLHAAHTKIGIPAYQKQQACTDRNSSHKMCADMIYMRNCHVSDQQIDSETLKESVADKGLCYLQGTHDLYRTDAMTLPYWIITFGATYFVFAMCVPHLHGLRWWSSISSILVIVFMAIIFGVSIHDGKLHASCMHSGCKCNFRMQ